jgi:hypothetical protein
MALDTYAALKTSVLSWLARPGDPLVEPAVDDMVKLFEAEANRRLRVGAAEKYVTLTTIGGTGGIALPNDFLQARRVSCDGYTLAYVPPSLLPGLGGPPLAYTLWGNTILWIGPLPDTVYDIELIYQSGVPPLAGGDGTNWLLDQHPDAYLFGTLAEAELYIGHDERAPMWLQRREAAFASIEMSDRKARWGGPLQIRAHGIQIAPGSAHGGGTVPTISGGNQVYVGTTPPATVNEGDLWWDSSSTGLGGGQLYVYYLDPTGVPGQWVAATNQPGSATAGILTLTPSSGDTIVISPGAPSVYISSGSLAALTVQLPATPPLDNTVQISFAHDVEALAVQTSTGGAVTGAPDNAFGPGAALIFRYVPPGVWIYWK